MQLYKDKKWLETKLKEIGNKEQIGKLCGVSGDTIERWRKKLDIQQYPYKHPRKKYIVNSNFFNEIDTEEKAYWLGFIMGDGNIEKNNMRFNIILKEDDFEHLKKLNHSLSSTYKILLQSIDDNRGFNTQRANLRISSKEFCKSLNKNFIFPQKTGNELIPSTVPDNLIKHFIRGFFDADGSVCKSSNRDYLRFNIASCSEKIIQQIITHLNNELNINLQYKEINRYSKPFFILESNSKNNTNKFLNYIYNNSNIYLDRKYNIWKKYI